MYEGALTFIGIWLLYKVVRVLLYSTQKKTQESRVLHEWPIDDEVDLRPPLPEMKSLGGRRLRDSMMAATHNASLRDVTLLAQRLEHLAAHSPERFNAFFENQSIRSSISTVFDVSAFDLKGMVVTKLTTVHLGPAEVEARFARAHHPNWTTPRSYLPSYGENVLGFRAMIAATDV